MRHKNVHAAEIGVPCKTCKLVARYDNLSHGSRFLPRTFIASTLLGQTTAPNSARTQLESRWLLSHNSLHADAGRQHMA